jgi:signal transduction histidine kinase/CheY-like chemotaxis protein
MVRLGLYDVQQAPAARHVPARPGLEARLAAGYAALGLTLFLLLDLARDLAAFDRARGVAFVLLTAAVLFATLRRWARERDSAEAEGARARAEGVATVEAARRQLDQLLERLPVGLVVVDATGHPEYVNATARSVVGDDPVALLAEGPDAPLTLALSGHDVAAERRVVRPTGEAIVRVTARPLVDARGHLERVVVLLEDATARAHLEDQLAQARKMEAVGQLAAGVAHDFNNVLTAIMGYTDLAIADTSAPPVSARLQEVRRASERGARLTQQLLLFSRRRVVDPRDLRIDRVAGEMAGMLRQVLGKRVELVTDLRAPDAVVRIDQVQLEQVLLNLTLNARDAMAAGGVVTVRTQTLAGPPRVALSVSDTGPGIDPSVRSRLFEPFFTTKPAGQGTGLGLSIVRGVVDQTGAEIAVESEPGRGATFRVTWPVVEAGPADPAPSRRRVILVVDDEELLRSLAREVLRAAGHDVLLAATGPEAIALAARTAGPIDLVISDVVMPGMGGPELVRALLAARPELRALLISGHPLDELAARGALAAYAVEALTKPFTSSELVAAVERALGLAQGTK